MNASPNLTFKQQRFAEEYQVDGNGSQELDSYLRHFRRIRALAGIPKDFRPNYCLRDTIATRLLSSGLSLDEVAHQLGHTPGSPMTRRYARFLASAQQNIADRSQRVMDEMLD